MKDKKTSKISKTIGRIADQQKKKTRRVVEELVSANTVADQSVKDEPVAKPTAVRRSMRLLNETINSNRKTETKEATKTCAADNVNVVLGKFGERISVLTTEL
jgi:hypothetical protein